MKAKFCLLFSIVLFMAFAFAQEESSDKVKDAREYAKQQSKLNQYESQLKGYQKSLADLIKAKQQGYKKIKSSSDSKEEIDVLDAIVEKHNLLTEAHDNYEKQRKLLKYRFPGKGDQIERRYMPLRPPSLKQVEREIGLNGQLTELKVKTDRKYAQFRKSAEKELDSAEKKKAYKTKKKPSEAESKDKKRLKLSQ